MQIVKTINEWQQKRLQFNLNQTIGFVPTMGCLHDGHQALLRHSAQENDITVLSIFVNPTQFNEQLDYEAYPRTVAQDIKLAEAIGVDYVFMPSVEQIYPSGEGYMNLQTSAPISQIMEGKYRPGHFDGVLTIVLKLLLLVRPNSAYFGEKDYQQLQLIRDLVKNYFLNCDIIGFPTVRERSGLALSSRNKRLSNQGFEIAKKMAQTFHQYQSLSKEALLTKMNALGVQVEYLVEFEDRAYLAARVEDVRLIDNIQLIN